MDEDHVTDVALEKPRPVSERYFSQHRVFANVKDATGHDQHVLQHSNGLCIVGIAEGHPIRAQGKKVTAVRYRPNCTKNKPSGKKKIHAVWVNANDTAICDVDCEDGTTYALYGAVRGSLFEINLQLAKNPDLVATHPTDRGYLAIIMPKRDEKKIAVDKLLTLDDYAAVLKARSISAEADATSSANGSGEAVDARAARAAVVAVTSRQTETTAGASEVVRPGGIVDTAAGGSSVSSLSPTATEAEIQAVVDERQQAKLVRDFKTADALRDQLRAIGVNVNDKVKEWSHSDGRRGAINMSRGGCGGPSSTVKKDANHLDSEGPPLKKMRVATDGNA